MTTLGKQKKLKTGVNNMITKNGREEVPRSYFFPITIFEKIFESLRYLEMDCEYCFNERGRSICILLKNNLGEICFGEDYENETEIYLMYTCKFLDEYEEIATLSSKNGGLIKETDIDKVFERFISQKISRFPIDPNDFIKSKDSYLSYFKKSYEEIKHEIKKSIKSNSEDFIENL